jgi:hypothetical protein
MKFSKSTSTLLGTFIIAALVSACGTASAATVEPSPTEVPPCPVTPGVVAEPPDDPNADPFGNGPWVINEDQSIWVSPMGWMAGSNGNKVIWIRPAGSDLEITGQRLDGEAGELDASIPGGYSTGFEVMGLGFPSSGCWQMTATAGESRLEFVVDVK